jgi:rubrerythrin
MAKAPTGKKYKPDADGNCDKCGRPLVIRNGKQVCPVCNAKRE